MNFGLRVRTRRRPARGREPAGGGLRRVGGQSAECDRAQDGPARRSYLNGLIFAGVDGAPEEQGDPAALKVAPRGGFSYSLNTKTVLRGGYGLFYAPWNYSRGQHGQAGFTRDTSMNQSDPRPRCRSRRWRTRSRRPDPADWQQSGVADQYRHDPLRRPEQGQPEGAPVLVRRPARAAGNMAVTIGYIGATGRDIGYYGTGGGDTTEAININQIDPAVARAVFPGPNGRGRRGPARQRPQPVLRGPRHRRVRQPADDSGRPAPAAVPAVRRHLEPRMTDGGRRRATPRRSCSRARPAGGAAGSAIR